MLTSNQLARPFYAALNLPEVSSVDIAHSCIHSENGRRYPKDSHEWYGL